MHPLPIWHSLSLRHSRYRRRHHFRQAGLSFSELSTSFLSSLNPYSDDVEANISLNNSFSLSLLNIYASPIRSSPSDGRTDPVSPSILSSSRNLFILVDFNCHHSLWDSRDASDICQEEVFDWVISSDLIPLNNPDIPTLLYRFSRSRSFLTFPLLSPHSSCPVPWRCFRTWVLNTNQFFYLSLSFQFFAPTSIPLPSIFRKLGKITLPSTFTPTVFPQRNTRPFLFPLLLSYISGTECSQIYHSF